MVTPEAACAPILDDVIWTELQILGDDVVCEIVELFVTDVPQRMSRIQHAISARSPEAILREAHGLKGSALGIGAARLAELCAAIERDTRDGRFDLVASRWTDLGPEFVQVCRTLGHIRG
jgi:histidine phosphotransfer protein HptB